MAPSKKAVAKKSGGTAGSGKVSKPRNYLLAPGLVRFSKSRMYHKKALYKKVKHGKKEGAKKERKPKTIEKDYGGKGGGKRQVRIKKAPAFYHPEGAPLPRQRRRSAKSTHGAPKLRKSITPGTVLILLAGRHRGKRVVFLKQLKSGLLLVTGPYKVNGCPLRRIQQSYVIATSTKLNLSSLQLPEHLGDEYFRRLRLSSGSKKKEEDIFASTKEKYSVSEQRKADQKAVDASVLSALKTNHGKEAGLLKKYLAATFSLRHGVYPHQLKF